MPKYRLSDMEFDEISLVKSGDDHRAKVVIAKSADVEKEARPSWLSRRGTNRRGSDTLTTGKTDQEDRMPQVKKSEDDGSVEINKDDLPDEVVEYIEDLEAIAESVIESVDDDESEGVQKDDDEEDDENEDENEDDGDEVTAIDEVLKSNPALAGVFESITKAAADANKRAESAEEIAKEERDRRVKQEAITKAEQLPMVAEDKAVFADLIMKIEENLGAEDAEAVMKYFQAANHQIAEGNFFDEIGKAGVDTDITASVDAKAAEIRKAHPDMTEEQSIERAYSENPKLYDESLKGS